MKYIFAILACTMVLAAKDMKSFTVTREGLSFTATYPRTVKSGRALHAKLTFTNKSKKPVVLATTNNLFRDVLVIVKDANGKWCKRTLFGEKQFGSRSDGEHVRIVRRGKRTIPAKKSYSLVVNIAQLYDMGREADTPYTMTLVAEIVNPRWDGKSNDMLLTMQLQDLPVRVLSSLPTQLPKSKHLPKAF